MRPAVHATRKKLPGHIRQRVKRSIDQLAERPRLPRSKELNLPDNVSPNIRAEWEVRRVRLDDWRIVYGISENWEEVAILTIQKRPPYDYQDLEMLISEL
jgi:mRNA-degrading endonuclease RelE of RelBE toxin-antitoxin system